MEKYVISCCSSADLSEEYLTERNIPYVCFHFEVDGKIYDDDLGKSLPYDEFYQAMTEGADTKTSQVNADEYEAHFKKYLDQGYDILHVTLSSGISGSINSANIAADTLREEYPDRKIYILDSFAASSGFGLLVDKLADLRDEGKTIDEVYEWGTEHRLHVQHWFFTSDLTYLIRGGRVSKAAGAIGGLLNICPLMNVDFLGKLIPRYKVRTKKKVIRATVDKMEELAENGANYNGKCFLSHSACPDDAQAVISLIEKRFPNLDGGVKLFDIGGTIGSHTGPGTIALFFWGAKRED